MNFVEDLIVRDRLKIKDGKVAVKPESRQSYTVFPINTEDGVLYISVEEYVGLKMRMYQFTEDLNGLEYFEANFNRSAPVTAPTCYPEETIKAAIGELTKMLEAYNV